MFAALFVFQSAVLEGGESPWEQKTFNIQCAKQIAFWTPRMTQQHSWLEIVTLLTTPFLMMLTLVATLIKNALDSGTLMHIFILSSL